MKFARVIFALFLTLPLVAPSVTAEASGQILQSGSTGSAVYRLQRALERSNTGDFFAYSYYTTGFGNVTERGLRAWQSSNGYPSTGVITVGSDQWLTLMSQFKPYDRRCYTGRVLCVSKMDRELYSMQDGKVVRHYPARFGASNTPTREGTFKVYYKDMDHVSSLYHTSMPYAMFFSGGQAVHFSPDFAARGYSGASHGCVNIANQDGAAWLYANTPTNTKVVIYN